MLARCRDCVPFNMPLEAAIAAHQEAVRQRAYDRVAMFALGAVMMAVKPTLADRRDARLLKVSAIDRRHARRFASAGFTLSTVLKNLHLNGP